MIEVDDMIILTSFPTYAGKVKHRIWFTQIQILHKLLKVIEQSKVEGGNMKLHFVFEYSPIMLK